MKVVGTIESKFKVQNFTIKKGHFIRY